MWLAPLLIVLSSAAAGFIAFGNDDRWIHHAHGLAVVLLSRRLLWPLVTLAVFACVGLIGLVIANRRSAWWLIGLLPVLALLGKHFAQRPTRFILENPIFVAADDSRTGLQQSDWVVGVVLNDQAFALPYDMLATTPVVFLTAHDKRALLMFNAAGNRALARGVNREFKARDLEIVAAPGGVPMLYDSRLGQFIVTETAETPQQTKPMGLGASITTEKMPWGDWHRNNAETKVLLSYAAPGAAKAPQKIEHRVALIATTQPTVIDGDRLSSTPTNFKSGDVCLLTLRDAAGRPHAFERKIGADLFPTFSAKTNRKLPDAALVDSDSGSAWTIDGKAIAGTLKGSKLKELPLETDLDWPTLKFWQPGLSILHTDAH